jgi:hypothetical protein
VATASSERRADSADAVRAVAIAEREATKRDLGELESRATATEAALARARSAAAATDADLAGYRRRVPALEAELESLRDAVAAAADSLEGEWARREAALAAEILKKARHAAYRFDAPSVADRGHVACRRRGCVACAALGQEVSDASDGGGPAGGPFGKSPTPRSRRHT